MAVRRDSKVEPRLTIVKPPACDAGSVMASASACCASMPAADTLRSASGETGNCPMKLVNASPEPYGIGRVESICDACPRRALESARRGQTPRARRPSESDPAVRRTSKTSCPYTRCRAQRWATSLLPHFQGIHRSSSCGELVLKRQQVLRTCRRRHVLIEHNDVRIRFCASAVAGTSDHHQQQEQRHACLGVDHPLHSVVAWWRCL